MELARRLSLIQPSPTLAMLAKAASLAARGIDVVDLSVGEPDFDTARHVTEAAKRALDSGAMKYTPVEGTPALRQAVATWVGRAHRLSIDPAEVIISSGAKHSIFTAVHAVIDEGDEGGHPDAGLGELQRHRQAGGRPARERADLRRRWFPGAR